MSDDVRIIKKYPNRRLYDTTTSNYITLEDVKKLVLDNVAFKVEDAKTKEDLTRNILLQIILEAEAGQGSPMFSSDVLAKIIRFYGHAMQGMMGNYLEKNVQTFVDIQKKLQEQSGSMLGGAPPLNADAWSEFIKMQGPAIQSMMGSYLEQSASAFLETQQQMQKQTRSMFGNFPFSNFAAGQNPFPPSSTGDTGTASPKKDDGSKKDGA